MFDNAQLPHVDRLNALLVRLERNIERAEDDSWVVLSLDATEGSELALSLRAVIHGIDVAT